jgi:L1 cell adhesion molecule like protein
VHPECLLTTISSRRLIGRRFEDPIVKKDMDSWPFKVVDDGNGNPKVEVQYLGSTHTFSPQEISAMVLNKVSDFRCHQSPANTDTLGNR